MQLPAIILSVGRTGDSALHPAARRLHMRPPAAPGSSAFERADPPSRAARACARERSAQPDGPLPAPPSTRPGPWHSCVGAASPARVRASRVTFPARMAASPPDRSRTLASPYSSVPGPFPPRSPLRPALRSRRSCELVSNSSPCSVRPPPVRTRPLVVSTPSRCCRRAASTRRALRRLARTVSGLMPSSSAISEGEWPSLPCW